MVWTAALNLRRKITRKSLRNNFFTEHIRATVFGLSFVNPTKKSKGTSLVKFLYSGYFNK